MRAGVDEGVDARRVGTSRKRPSRDFYAGLPVLVRATTTVFAPNVWLVCAEEFECAEPSPRGAPRRSARYGGDAARGDADGRSRRCRDDPASRGFPDGPRGVHHPLRTRRGGGWRAFADARWCRPHVRAVEPALPASPPSTRPPNPSPWRARRPRRTSTPRPRGTTPSPRWTTTPPPSGNRPTTTTTRRTSRAPPWRRPTATRTTQTRTRTPRKPPRDTRQPRPRPRRPRPSRRTTTRSTRTQTRMVSSPRSPRRARRGGTPRRPPTRRRPIPSVPSIPSIPSVPRLSGGNTPTSNVETRGRRDGGTERGARRLIPTPAERPRGSGSVDATAVSSGAIAAVDVNASEAWRVAGAAYYDTQRTIPESEEDARSLPSNPPPRNRRNREPNRKSRTLARRIPADQLRRMNVGCGPHPPGWTSIAKRREPTSTPRPEPTPTPRSEPSPTPRSEPPRRQRRRDATPTPTRDRPPPRTSTPPRASAAAAPTAREENPPPRRVRRTSWTGIAGARGYAAWSAYRHGEPSPAPATEETRDEKDETKTEEEPPARTARPVAPPPPPPPPLPPPLVEEEEGCADEDAEPAPSEETRRASKRGANASDALASAPKRQNLRKLRAWTMRAFACS